MDANAVFAAVAVGTFLLLCVVGWYLIQALRQAQRTALAMEEFLAATRPKVEAATDQLGSLIGRVDRFMATMEEGRGAAAGAAGMIGRALAGWSAGTQIFSAIATVVASAVQAWTMFSRPKEPAAQGAAEPASR